MIRLIFSVFTSCPFCSPSRTPRRDGTSAKASETNTINTSSMRWCASVAVSAACAICAASSPGLPVTRMLLIRIHGFSQLPSLIWMLVPTSTSTVSGAVFWSLGGTLLFVAAEGEVAVFGVAFVGRCFLCGFDGLVISELDEVSLLDRLGCGCCCMCLHLLSA